MNVSNSLRNVETGTYAIATQTFSAYTKDIIGGKSTTHILYVKTGDMFLVIEKDPETYSRWLIPKLPLIILFRNAKAVPLTKFGVVIPVVPLIVTGIIFLLYTTVQTDPLGMVTITPALTVIGPAVIAFLVDGIE